MEQVPSFAIGDTIRTTLEKYDMHYINPSFICFEIGQSVIFKERYIVSTNEFDIGKDQRSLGYMDGKERGVNYFGKAHCKETCVSSRMLLTERRRRDKH